MNFEVFERYLEPYLADAKKNGWPIKGRSAFARLKRYSAAHRAHDYLWGPPTRVARFRVQHVGAIAGILRVPSLAYNIKNTLISVEETDGQ